ncbi:MAG: hypothetical protein HY707_00340 [Ignavibacteriae bacterium]|nr:hypothetical protein [Ignavibacteriota bacterium]
MKHFALFLTLALAISVTTFGQVPKKLSYQGLLTTSGGTPVADGSYDLKFEIYDASAAGILRHSETQFGVPITKGTFSVVLDSLAGIFNESLYLEVTAVTGPAGPSYPLTFLPRSELTSAPYAFRADTANVGVIVVTDTLWRASGDNVYRLSGNLGIGTASPSEKLHVAGSIKASGTISSGNSITIDGANDRITASSGIINFDDEDLITTGKLGIGITSPVYKLDVSEDINIASDKRYRIAGNPIVSTRGINNIFLGATAGFSNTTGYNNSFVGFQSGFFNTTGSNNCFFGLHAGLANTTGYQNTFLGSSAGLFNTDGGGNSFVGHQSGHSNTMGSLNTFLGNEAGYSNSSASENTFVGYRAGRSTTTSGGNSFIGSQSGVSNTTGSGNSFFGFATGGSNVSGANNTFIGLRAGYSNTTGSFGTIVGYDAGLWKTSGDFNTFLGYEAGSNNVTGSANLFLGYRAGFNETGSNKLYIANSSIDPPLIYGDFSTGRIGIGTTFLAGEKLRIKGSGLSEVMVALENTDAIAAAGMRLEPARFTVGTFGGVPTDFLTGATTRMRITFEGNVGIGTTSPVEKLDVNGNIKVSGTGMWHHSGTLVFDGTSPTAWTDLDLSSYVGANYALVYLKISNGGDNFAFRSDGETDEFYNANAFASSNRGWANGATSATVVVETGSNGIVEWKTQSAVASQVRLVGFVK